MKKNDLLNIDIRELNENGKRIFETSDQNALLDLFGDCDTIEEINKAADELTEEGL